MYLRNYLELLVFLINCNIKSLVLQRFSEGKFVPLLIQIIYQYQKCCFAKSLVLAHNSFIYSHLTYLPTTFIRGVINVVKFK